MAFLPSPCVSRVGILKGIIQKKSPGKGLLLVVGFIILSTDEHHLQSLIPIIQDFLTKTLRLELHPRKVIIKKLIQGIDFVGYVLFSHYKLVRTRTKQRMKKRLSEAYSDYLSGKSDVTQVDRRLQSYLGILSHANQHALTQAVNNAYWVRTE